MKSEQKTITNRELLRQYKMWRNKLMNNEIQEIAVSQSDGSVIKITYERPMSSFEKIVAKIKKNPMKGLTRPEEDII